MDYSIFDLEGDSLTPTKIHCLSVRMFTDNTETKNFVLTDYDDMRGFLLSEKCLIGHNIYRFDIPVCERILDIKIQARLIDTLGLSWYLSPERHKHGLDEWGQFFGIEKPPITDWENLPIEDYIWRCNEDTRINAALFDMQMDMLWNIYQNVDEMHRIINYLMFKLDCAREQEEVKWPLAVEQCKANLEKLLAERDIKVQALSKAMPEVIGTKVIEYPDEKLYKKDGNLSKRAQEWYYVLGTNNLPIDHASPITIETGREPGNPNSTDQVKSWLFSLGWVPDVFKYIKEEKDGVSSQRAIPQINKIYPEEGVADSILALREKEPAIEYLDSLSIISHRIGILKGFLENVDSEGYLKAEISGLTNTLRFKHTTIVNLPTIYKPYGEYIRSVLTCPEGMILCGSDMSGLESTTQDHYMIFYDPEYVRQKNTPGFDPHLDLAELAQLLTHEQVEEHKLADRTKGIEGKKYTKIRLDAKKVNFSCLYGAGPPKIALTANMPLAQAKLLHKTYWQRNKAVKYIARDVTIKKVGEQMWLFNPISRFWYSLRFEKDKFSTLNQGSAVYCFDTWVSHIRPHYRLCGQFHDEVAFPIVNSEESKQKCKEVLKEAIDKTNDQLKLNTTLKISTDFGQYYSDIH